MDTAFSQCFHAWSYMSSHISLVKLTRGRYELEWLKLLNMHFLSQLKLQCKKGCFHVCLSVDRVRASGGCERVRLSLQRCIAVVGLSVSA